MPEGPTQEQLHPRELAAKQRAVLLASLRTVFVAGFVIVGTLAILGGENTGDRIPLVEGWYLILGFGIVLAVIIGLVDVLTPNKKISTVASVFFGLMAAMLATFVAGQFIDLIARLYGIQYDQLISTAKVLVGIGLAYLGVITVLQTQDDFRLVIPYVEFAKQIRGARPFVLDTSVLIDARIVDIGETGLIQSPLVIPQFVVTELQMLADSRDRLKRERGRRGLDVITKLQRVPLLDVSIDDTPVVGKAVDQMLVAFAGSMPAVIVTTDLGLTRVGRIQGVQVLNLNDLANAMKPSLVQGEQFNIRLVKAGEQKGQGVGYLEDGTMVVAEDGGEHVGKVVLLTVTNMVQTSAGRMIFGRVSDSDDDADSSAGESDDLPASTAGQEARSLGTGEDVTGGPTASQPTRPGPLPHGVRGHGRNPRR